MVLTTEPPLQSSDLSHVQCSMMASVNIPHLLKMNVKEIDLYIRLQYDIQGKRMLSQRMRGDRMSMPEFYAFFIQIVRALQECNQYMLHPSSYRIHEEFIFVEGELGSGKLYFTYIPLQQLNVGPSVASQISSLIMKCMTCVTQLEGGGIQKLVQMCNDEAFSLDGLLRLLQKLLAGEEQGQMYYQLPYSESPISQERTSTTSVTCYREDQRDCELDSEDRIHNQSHLNKNKYSMSVPISKPNHLDPATLMRPESTELDEKVLWITGKTRTYVMLTALLASALSWKLAYLDHISTSTLYISAGLTLLFILGMVSALRWRRHDNQHNQKPIKNSNDQASDENFSKRGWNEKAWRWNDKPLEEDNFYKNLAYVPQSPNLNHLVQSGNGDLLEKDVTSYSHISSHADISDAWQLSRSGTPSSKFENTKMNPAFHTELLNPPFPQATTLLTQDSSVMNTPFLERKEATNGVKEDIPLTGASFVIGRSQEVVQYVDKTVGISRAHVEVALEGKTYTIKDLGSRNGTKLKGEPMAPYKAYPLANGDVFSIASTEFKLCLG
nr:DUF6382 domain-containing protein [Paenibacillus shirakamiensis]